MRVIVIGSDRNLFVQGSAVRERVIGQGALFEELHVIVFTKRDKQYKTEQIASNVYLHPTRSWSRFLYMRDAFSVSQVLHKRFKKQVPVDGKTVISAQDPFESGLVAARIATLFCSPLHIQIHTDFFSPQFKTSFLNKIRLIIAKKVLPKASAVRVVSEEIKRGIIKTNLVSPEKISVLPVFIDIGSYSTSTKPDQKHDLRVLFPHFKFVALMASRLTVEKDIGLAIKAFAPLVKDEPHIGLVIIGDGPSKSHLARLVRRLHIVDHVRFIPWNWNLSDMYRSANVFLVSSSYEGFGLTIAEALLSGTPVVTTNVGIAHELKDGTEVFVCPVGDSDCISRKIRLLIKDHSLRELLKVNGRQAILRHIPDPDSYKEQYRMSFELAWRIYSDNNS